jgi:iron-only hydrogenase group A
MKSKKSNNPVKPSKVVETKEPKQISLTINGISVKGKETDKIIDVANRYNIKIPALCMHPRLERIGACRMCVVEVEGSKKLVSSCTVPIQEGMVVRTHSPKVIKARKTNMQLLLANHKRDCLTCDQNLRCLLQKYSEELMIRSVPYEGEMRKTTLDDSSVSIIRDNSKCILCGRCVRMCGDIQTVHAIGQHNRGFNTVVCPPLGLDMNQSACVNCGQCIIACPTGALSEKSNLPEVISAITSGKYLIAQTAPSIRAALGECFGLPEGQAVTGKMVAALKEIGFKKVFDTNFGADLTIIEEATELIKRLKENKNLPMITTCCPAWIKFGEQFYFEQLNHMSTCRSPQAIVASLIKTYFAEKLKIKPEDIVLVDIMPCTAKKYEIQRPEFAGKTDYVLTTVELGKLIQEFNIDFANLKDAEFDNPMGESSGASALFGQTGGVMEAALRTAADWITKSELKQIEYTPVRGMQTLKEATVKLGKHTLNLAVVHTLGEARKIMEQIRAGTCKYHFIEIMACYGGCIGGGGQPRMLDRDETQVLNKRRSALINVDKTKKIRKSHLNPAALQIYKEYIGDFGGERAHELFHTTYTKKDAV